MNRGYYLTTKSEAERYAKPPHVTPLKLYEAGVKICDECGHPNPQEVNHCFECGCFIVMFVDRKSK